MVDLVAGRLFPALALEIRFGCAVVDVANFQFEDDLAATLWIP